MQARYQLESSDEDRQQLYWGAFMLGCAAFHDHRRDGYCIDEPAVGKLARARLHTILTTSTEQDPYVDDESLALTCFTDGFAAGYRQRSERCGVDTLLLRHESESAG